MTQHDNDNNVVQFPNRGNSEQMNRQTKQAMPAFRQGKEHPEEDPSGKKGTTVRLPGALQNVLEEDAKRCKRSFTKQVEALLEAYYFGASFVLRHEGFQEMAKVSSFASPILAGEDLSIEEQKRA